MTSYLVFLLSLLLILLALAFDREVRLRRALERLVRRLLHHWRSRGSPHRPKSALIMTCLVTLAGCHDGATEVAREAADRQAAQNSEMMRLNREVAQGVKQLVTADAASRRELLAAHNQLQAYAGELTGQFERLEEQRAEFGRERQRTVTIADALRGGGALLAGILALAIVRQLLASARQDEGAWVLAEEYLVSPAAAGDRLACQPRDASVDAANLLESRS